LSRDGEPGQNYLCAGLELFFKHTMPAMRTMAQLLQQRRAPSDIMAMTAESDKLARHQPCPCGSGRKLRQCHGNESPDFPFSHVSLLEDEPTGEDGATMIGASSLPTISTAGNGAPV
jgi:uncharacterized protein